MMNCKTPLVYIIILNWNGWEDTIECLESVFRLNYDNFQVIVCDNDSSDGSLDNIKAWADGHLDSFVPFDNPLRHLCFPPVNKTIPYREYDRGEAEAGGSCYDVDFPLILIQTGSNLGFAGGNNVGLRYAMARNDFDFAWLLNNDTLIEPTGLSFLLDKSYRYRSSGNKVGLLGAKLMHYYSPETIQGVGGIYNKWFATTKHIGLFELDHGQFDTEDVIDRMDYPIGASMFFSKEFISDVGVMCENYFLYFEEIDWVLSGSVKGWGIGYCWKTRVFHKEGGSIGSNSIAIDKSKLSDSFGLKNRIKFTRKFYPYNIWTVRLGFVFVLVNRIKRRQFDRIGLVLRALKG